VTHVTRLFSGLGIVVYCRTEIFIENDNKATEHYTKYTKMIVRNRLKVTQKSKDLKKIRYHVF